MKSNFILLLIFFLQNAFAQNVGIGTNTPKAALDITSTTNGFLPPRMTFSQRNSIVNPAQGLIIYCTDCGTKGGEPQFYNGISWLNINGNPASVYIENLPSITIGNQVWSSQNLNVDKYQNGDPIPQVVDPTQWANLTTGAWCWYNNDSANYADIYGKLYNWYAVNDPRGLAPSGWRVPLESDWNKLVKYVDASADTVCQTCTQSWTAGGVLKSITEWNSPNAGATNSYGFNGFPGGDRFIYNDAFFGGLRIVGIWWSANNYDTSIALSRKFHYNYSEVFRESFDKKTGLSVRVVRD